MKTKRIRSRILQYFSKDLMQEIFDVCNYTQITDNNSKVEIIVGLLDKYKIDYVELGPGTNRFAILIDGYVFKIALDKWGIQDNLNEFTTSQELQPYVVKTYETNKLITVCEYVTVISREEFEEKKHKIREVLYELSQGYLLGDVGSVPRNFCNWGYRDTGELVILDYAYIYKVEGQELLCSKDQTLLEYDDNFHNLICPRCGTKYTFMDVRRKVPMSVEKRENELALNLAFKLKKPLEEFKVHEELREEEEENVMRSRDYYDEKFDKKKKREEETCYTEENAEKAYEDALKEFSMVSDDSKGLVIETRELIDESIIEQIVEDEGYEPQEPHHFATDIELIHDDIDAFIEEEGYGPEKKEEEEVIKISPETRSTRLVELHIEAEMNDKELDDVIDDMIEFEEDLMKDRNTVEELIEVPETNTTILEVIEEHEEEVEEYPETESEDLSEGELSSLRDIIEAEDLDVPEDENYVVVPRDEEGHTDVTPEDQFEEIKDEMIETNVNAPEITEEEEVEAVEELISDEDDEIEEDLATRLYKAAMEQNRGKSSVRVIDVDEEAISNYGDTDGDRDDLMMDDITEKYKDLIDEYDDEDSSRIIPMGRHKDWK